MRATAKQVGALWFDGFPRCRGSSPHLPPSKTKENMNKTDTQPDCVILLQHGTKKVLAKKFGYNRMTIQRYLKGTATMADSQHRAKKVREYALNHLNGQYINPQTITNPTK